jgi:hypothetical protein
MSIPDRFYRIAKYKLREIKERWDDLDMRYVESETGQRKPADARRESERELDDIDDARVISAPPPLRTPEQIAPAIAPTAPRSAQSTGYARPSAPPPSAPAQSQASSPDPLAYHYRLLGVEVGADFSVVQSAYNRLAARSDPARFPAGSEDARTAESIRARLDASYAALRDALDPTARRFDLLEY